MKQYRGYLLVLLVFASGTILGFSLRHFAGFHHPHHFGPPPADVILNRIKRELSLTEDQVTKARPIVEEFDSRITAVLNDGRPKMKASFEEAIEKLDKILTEDQKPELKKLKERMSRFEGPPPPPPPPQDQED